MLEREIDLAKDAELNGNGVKSVQDIHNINYKYDELYKKEAKKIEERVMRAEERAAIANGCKHPREFVAANRSDKNMQTEISQLTSEIKPRHLEILKSEEADKKVLKATKIEEAVLGEYQKDRNEIIKSNDKIPVGSVQQKYEEHDAFLRNFSTSDYKGTPISETKPKDDLPFKPTSTKVLAEEDKAIFGAKTTDDLVFTGHSITLKEQPIDCSNKPGR